MTMCYLLFSSGLSQMDARIMYLDKGPWSHVSLVLSKDAVLEATPAGGVHVASLWGRMAQSDACCLRRVNVERKPRILAKMLGTPYDWNWLDGLPRDPHAFHCATLVAHVLGLKGPRYPEMGLRELWSFTHDGSGSGAAIQPECAARAGRGSVSTSGV